MKKQSKRNIFLLPILLLVILSFTLSLPENADANYWKGDRTNGVKGSVWYDPSVSSYGYTPHFDKGRAYWNVTPEVNLWKSETRNKYSDAYYIGTWYVNDKGQNEYYSGMTNGYQYYPLTNLHFSVSNNSNWDFAVVRLYHSFMKYADYNYYERVKAAAHEVGHSIKIAHPYDVDDGQEPITDKNMISIMNQGKMEIMKPDTVYESITVYDKQSVTKKWGDK